MWGSNLPVTRTPDAHWMTEARYRGQKVIAVAPDYADNVKFADEWLPAKPGTDAALAMAMGHVVLKEFFVDRQTPYFTEYVKTYTDLPHLVRLEEAGDGEYTAGKFLTAADLADHAGEENAAFKTVLIDARTGEPVVPNGSLGHRYGEAGVGKWNLELGDVDPLLSLLDTAERVGRRPDAALRHPRRRGRRPPARRARTPRRRPPRHHRLRPPAGAVRRRPPGPAGRVGRRGTTTPSRRTPRPGRRRSPASRPRPRPGSGASSPQNAEESAGRSMIVMGAGTNHWFHSDTIYRAFLTLTNLTGCQGVNGGGWAHYVGQEKVRPITGYTQIANALDWNRPPRNMIQTAFWYLHTDQFRYDQFGADTLSATTGKGQLAGKSTADVIAQSARMGWMPSYPTFDRNPLDLSDDAAAAGKPVGEYVVEQLKSGDLDFAGEDPDAPEQLPADPVDLAGQPARLLGQGQRVLPQAPARHRLLGARDRDARGPAPGRRDVARRGARGQARPADDDRLPADQHHDLLRRRPARPPPGTRSTTSTPPTCTRSCTRSTRPSRRRGRPAPTGTPGRPSPRSSASSPRPTSASARTSSPSRSRTTPRTRWPTRTASSATGRRASASRSPVSPCPSSSRSSATTARSPRR